MKTQTIYPTKLQLPKQKTSLDNLGNLDEQTKRIGCLPFTSIPDDFDDLAKDEIVELFTKTDDDLFLNIGK